MTLNRKITMAISYLNSAFRDLENSDVSFPFYRDLLYSINNLVNFRSLCCKEVSPISGFKRKCYNIRRK